jgi:hypothetical protein
MTAEDIFNEILKSPEFQTIFQIPKEDVDKEDFSSESDYRIIEIFKVILKGQENHRSKEQIFQTIQRQIMKL